jgi:alkanesulfonate monooxygenase SsuD/methylene tetrahydromethanopterin reductase-like flavin-dependent oxidoreductase (luciferase family)
MSIPFKTAAGDAPSLDDVMHRAKLIESAGYDSIWTGDGTNRGSIRPDALMWLLVAAAATKRTELIVAVLQMPLRYTIDSAIRMMTLHGLSGGRFICGVGAGSTKDDFDAAGLDFSTRFKVLREQLAENQRLQAGEQVGAASLHPWPSAIGGPPILIGSWAGSIWIKRAAQEYDGWIASGLKTNFRTLREGIQRFRDFGGKRAIVSSMHVDLSLPNADISDEDSFTLQCGPESAVERLNRLAEIGFDDVLIGIDLNRTAGELPEEEIFRIREVLKPG